MALLYAHRGAAAELPENTIPSFELALELGADALEMDVHCTSDGVVVVSHDPSGERMANIPVNIAASLWSDVSGWDVGWGFQAGASRPHAGKDFRIPTLEDVLATFPDTPINIDIKEHTGRAVELVLEVIRKQKAANRVTLASFSWKTLMTVRRRGYTGRTSLAPSEVVALVTLPRLVISRLPYFGTAAQIPIQQGPVRLDTKLLINKCHKLGMEVHYWTINDPQQAIRLVDRGADAIMTDDPRHVQLH